MIILSKLGNGKWSKYGKWSKCSESCLQFKERICNNPSPAYGGDDCFGNEKKYQFCNIDDCIGKYVSDIGQYVRIHEYLLCYRRRLLRNCGLST